VLYHLFMVITRRTAFKWMVFERAYMDTAAAKRFLASPPEYSEGSIPYANIDSMRPHESSNAAPNRGSCRPRHTFRSP
jgi:hypothetical protein